MAGFGLALFGARVAKSRIMGLEGAYKRALGKALMREAVELLKESKVEVPEKHRNLRNSGTRGKLKNDGMGNLFVEVGYGTKYALAVHELGEPGTKHAGKTINWSKKGSGAKYLQGPFERRLKGWKRRVMANTRKIVVMQRLGRI
jgi:hypothetical protein